MSKRDKELIGIHFNLSSRPLLGHDTYEVRQSSAMVLDFGLSAVSWGAASAYVDATYNMCLQLEYEFIERMRQQINLKKAALSLMHDQEEFKAAMQIINEDAYMLQRREDNLNKAYDDLLYNKGV